MVLELLEHLFLGIRVGGASWCRGSLCSYSLLHVFPFGGSLQGDIMDGKLC